MTALLQNWKGISILLDNYLIILSISLPRRQFGDKIFHRIAMLVFQIVFVFMP